MRGKPKADPASLARASADEAEAIVAGLRVGLVLRDQVVAAAEAGELHRGTYVWGANVNVSAADTQVAGGNF